MNTLLGQSARALGTLVMVWLCATAATAQAPQCVPSGSGYLHPRHEKADTLVVFIHGLGGDAVTTWRAESAPPTVWPCLVRDSIDELRHANIYLLGYPTGWFGDQPSLKTVSANVVERLRLEMVKHQKVVIIGHSLGGLIIADALHRIANEPSAAQLLDRVRLIALFGTPGAPSDLAAAVSRLSALNLITVSDQVQSLAGDERINQVVNAWRRSQKLQAVTRCFAEVRPVGSAWYMVPVHFVAGIFRGQAGGADANVIVPEESAYRLCQGRGLPIPASDHFSIVKPAGTEHGSHLKLSKAAQACVGPGKGPGPDRSLAGTPVSTATANWLRRFAADAKAARERKPDNSEPAVDQIVEGWFSQFVVAAVSTLGAPYAVPADPNSEARPFKDGRVGVYGLRQVMRSELLQAIGTTQLNVGEVEAMENDFTDGDVRSRLYQLRQAGWLESGDLVLQVDSARKNVEYILLLGRSAIDSGSNQALKGFLRIDRPACDPA